MNKLINLPSGSGKTHAYRELSSKGYAVIDLDAFVFKTSNGYCYHPDTYGYLKSLRNITCVGALTNDRLLDCFDKVISLDKKQVSVSNEIYLNTIHRNYIKGFSLDAAFFNNLPNVPSAFEIIANEATKGIRVNSEFPSLVNLQLRYAWKHRHLMCYNFEQFDSEYNEETIEFQDKVPGFTVHSKNGSYHANLGHIHHTSPLHMMYTNTSKEYLEHYEDLGLSYIKSEVNFKDAFMLEEQSIITFFDCQRLSEKILEKEFSSDTLTLIKNRLLTMDVWFQ